MKENNDSEEWIDIVMRIEDKKEKVKNLFCVDSFVSCVIQFPVSVSRDLIFSVIGITHNSVIWALRGMQDADQIESDGTSNSKVAILLLLLLLLFS